jgi:restriction endonuclease S subunit
VNESDKVELIVRSNGNPDLVGKCAVWDSSLDFVYASYLIRFRFNLDLVNPKFVMYFLSSQSGRQLIKPQAGGGTYNISSTSFKEVAIPLPDLDTQNLIVEKLDAEMKTLAQIRLMKSEAQAKIEKLVNSIWESS